MAGSKPAPQSEEQPDEEPSSNERKLARAVIEGDWYRRQYGVRIKDVDHPVDVSGCAHCSGQGGLAEYTVEWHTKACPVRLAAEVLGYSSDKELLPADRR